MSDAASAEALLDQAYGFNGPEQVSILEMAVREADAAQDVELGMTARMRLIEAATFCGYQEKALVAFSWCLGQVDKDPERFRESGMLWSYKWVLGYCHAFPQISTEQIERMLDDFQTRLARHTSSLRAAHFLRWSTLLHMGRLAEADASCGKWKESPRDYFADCSACELDMQVQLRISQEREEAALKLAQPILAGKLCCKEIPHVTLGRVALPLVKLNRLKEARDAYTKGYRLVSKNREYIDTQARHLMFLASQNDWTKGLNMMQRHLPWALESASLDRRYHFFLASGLLLEKLATEKNRPRKLRLPRAIACYREDDTYSPGDLAAWLLSEANAIVARFNQRNGNDFFTRLTDRYRAITLGTA